MIRSMLVFGTRPEAIKMAPVITELVRRVGRESVFICVTGQHREMLDQVLNLFDIVPDLDLSLMQQNQSLENLTASIIKELGPILREWKPDIVFVQGDTTTCFGAALASFYNHIPIAHIEAGLRTGDINSPWPEEANRKMVSSLAEVHFAPTEEAMNNLQIENIPMHRIMVTGNTVIDALNHVVDQLTNDHALKDTFDRSFDYLSSEKRLILVTGHRRENFGSGILNICKALSILSQREDVQIVYPVHLNPNIKDKVFETLDDNHNLYLIPPLEYVSFVYLMNRSSLILTDSGGVQEEAPALGKPVLVMRENTERPEGIKAGTVRLVGTNAQSIVDSTCLLLDNQEEYQRMVHAHNPYGDGHAARHIVERILSNIQ